jgi:hypothetical protein
MVRVDRPQRHRTRRAGVLGLVAVAAVAGSLAQSARATSTWVARDAASFASALAAARPGDTIQLADGSYPNLPVTNVAPSTPLTITGGRGARVDGFMVSGSSNVVFSGLTITPVGTQPTLFKIKDSSDIVIDRILLDGRSEDIGAIISTTETAGRVTIKNSELTNCGKGGRCIGPGALDLRILNNAFHDCYDCDFIRGGSNGGNGTLIQGNTFDRAVPGTCTGTTTECPHSDHVQIMSGGPWTIVGNRFGERRRGAADIFVGTGTNATNRIHDVLIASNLFVEPQPTNYGVRVSDSRGDGAGLPKRISIVNNTILAGGTAAVHIDDGYRKLDKDRRPLLANNILGVGSNSCSNGQSMSNLVLSGDLCNQDVAGPANLGSDASPTTGSTLVIDKADAGYAPKTDFFGRPRVGAPDRGAIEYTGT